MSRRRLSEAESETLSLVTILRRGSRVGIISPLTITIVPKSLRIIECRYTPYARIAALIVICVEVECRETLFCNLGAFAGDSATARGDDAVQDVEN